MIANQGVFGTAMFGAGLPTPPKLPTEGLPHDTGAARVPRWRFALVAWPRS